MLATQAPTATRDFEAIYSEAAGNATLVPWARCRPHSALVTWLNAVAPTLIRCGARVAVVGCGLGDDAREIARRGYDVTAFDASPTAIEWAKSIDPAAASMFHVADLFDLPLKWRHRFDLVVEIHTVQALPRERRAETLGAIADLASPHGHVLMICRGAEAPVTDDAGPPWPLTVDEVRETAAACGLAPVNDAIASFHDDADPPVLRIRTLLERA